MMLPTGKITKYINIGKTRTGKLVFKKHDLSIDWVQKSVLSSIKKLEKFYKIKSPLINLELVYSREEFNKIVGRETPEWMVAIALENKIYLFSTSIVEKFSSHKKSSLKKIITHEICHLFNNKLNKNILAWVDEGTALFLSNQEKPEDLKKTEWNFFIKNFLTKNIDYQSFCTHNGYKISYWAVRIIVETFNRDMLLNLIKINLKKEQGKRAENIKK